MRVLICPNVEWKLTPSSPKAKLYLLNNKITYCVWQPTEVGCFFYALNNLFLFAFTCTESYMLLGAFISMSYDSFEIIHYVNTFESL